MIETATPSTAKKMLLVGLLSLVLGWCFDFFFTEKIPGLSWPIYNIFVFLGFALLWRQWGRRWSPSTWWIIGPLFVISTGVAIFSSDQLLAVNTLTCLLLWLLLIAHVREKSLFSFSLAEYLRTARIPFAFVPNFFVGLADMFALRLHLHNKKIGSVMKGVVLAIPLLIIFGALFASADLIFKKYLQSFLHISLRPETVVHAVITFICAAIFLGAFTYLLRHRSVRVSSPSKTLFVIGSTEINVMLGLVAALFVVFMGIQITYLFGGQNTITTQGLTYAEYARHGFFELLVVAIFSFFILWAADQAMIRHNHSPKHFRWLATLLLTCVLGIMASAFLRLALYEQAYGFTTARFFSHAFTIWLGLLVVFMMIKIIRRTDEVQFLRWVYGSSLAMVVALNLSNPDVFVAKNNIERQQRTGKFDVDYLAHLSVDAIDQQLAQLSSADPSVRQIMADHFFRLKKELTKIAATSPWSWQWSRSRAAHLLDKQTAVIDQWRTEEASSSQSSLQ